MMNLWRHECQRVLADRFIIDGDKEWFDVLEGSEGKEGWGLIAKKHKGLLQAPKQVVGVKRLLNDLLALSKLLAVEEPAVVLVRGMSIVAVVYGF